MSHPTSAPTPAPANRTAAATMAGLLSRPGFRAFWLANLISNLGTSAFVLAINWLTVKQHGAAGIACLALAYGIPQMLLQLVGGTVSDRLDRRRLFGLTQSGLLVMAVLILIASLRGLVPLWLLALVNGVNGLLADGSTRFLSDSIELGTWRAIGTCRGGEPSSQL